MPIYLDAPVANDPQPYLARTNKTEPSDFSPEHSLRFWQKVRVVVGGCWNWLAQPSANGYGGLWFSYPRKRRVLAHRWAYEALVAPIPHGMVIDHLCRNRRCVNPAHMRVCFMVENSFAHGSQFQPALNIRKSHCKFGHSFSPDNTRVSRKGHRYCRACKREYDNLRYAQGKRGR